MKKLYDEIKKKKWYKQAMNTKAYYVFTCCQGAMETLGGGLGFWAIVNGIYLEAFLPYEQFVEMGKKHLCLQKKDGKYIDRLMKKSKEKGRKLESYYNELKRKNIGGMKLQQVQKALKKLDRLNYDYWCHSYYCDLYDPNGEELLREELEKERAVFSEGEINILLKTNVLNYVQEERLALLKIVEVWKLSDKKGRELLWKHAKKYFYVENSWESTRVVGEGDFFERVKKLLESGEDIECEINRLGFDWSKEWERIRKEKGLSKEIMNVFYFFRKLIQLRDERKKYTLLTNHFYDVLFRRLGDVFGVDFEEMSVLLVEEVVGKVDVEKLKRKIGERKRLVLEKWSDGERKVYGGGGAVGMYNQLQKSYGYTGALRGRGVCKGVVKGIVRIVLGETHFTKFNEGEILVAPMTRPEFLPLMQQAGGIITEEGGVTCHAAVLSRELGVPCIVGTQKAMQKLKDGMLIEMNGKTGGIKVLSHLKLLTVQSLVDKEMEKREDLVKILEEGLLNITALAKKILPGISRQLGRKIDVHAVSMAIRRYKAKL